MRDHLTDRYFDTAHAIVQATVEVDLPALVAAVERLSDQLGEASETRVLIPEGSFPFNGPKATLVDTLPGVAHHAERQLSRKPIRLRVRCQAADNRLRRRSYHTLPAVWRASRGSG